MPLAFALTGGERHDLTAVPELLDGVRLARTLIVADRSYDADGLRSHLLLHGAWPVIPARRHRREPLQHDERVYRTRNRVERLMSKLKQFRRVATRYDQTAASFLAFVELAALRMWTDSIAQAIATWRLGRRMPSGLMSSRSSAAAKRPRRGARITPGCPAAT